MLMVRLSPTVNSSPRIAALTSSSSWLSQSSTRTWSPGAMSLPSSWSDKSDPGSTRRFNGKLITDKAEIVLMKRAKTLSKALKFMLMLITITW